MKRWACLLLSLALLFACALAHTVDTDVLLEGLDHHEWPDLNGVDTMYRPANQPWHGETENGTLFVYLDYVDCVNDDMLFMRLTLNLESYEKLVSPHVVFTVGGKEWVMTAEVNIDEYDGTFYEDYMIYFTDDSAELLKAIIKGGGRAQVFIDGEIPYHGVVIIPPEELAGLYDRYVNAGGFRQRFDIYHSMWPMTKRDIQAQ